MTATKEYTWGNDLSGTPQGTRSSSAGLRRDTAGGVGGLVLATETGTASPGSFSFHYDANPDYVGASGGNVVQVTDSNATVVATYTYNAFGKVRSASGPYATENNFTFSTKYHDEETGLAYYGFRYYAPETGCWLSRDPIGEEGGINLYAYVDNNSINGVDFLGLHQFQENVKQGWRTGTVYTIQFNCDENPNLVGSQPYGTQNTGFGVAGASTEAFATIDNVQKTVTKEKCDGGCYIYYTFDFNYEVWETIKVGGKPFGIDMQTEIRFKRDDFLGSRTVTTKKICCDEN